MITVTSGWERALLGGGLLAWAAARTWTADGAVATPQLMAVGLVGLLLCLQREASWIRSGLRGAASVLTALACGLLGTLWVTPLILSQDSVPWLSAALAMVLDPLVPSASGVEGEVLVGTATGLLRFRPTALFLGLDLWVPWALWCCAQCWRERRGGHWPGLMLAIVAVMLVRAAWNVATFADVEDVLSRQAPAATGLLHDPWQQLGWLALAWLGGLSTATRRGPSPSGASPAPVPSVRWCLGGLIALAACLLLVLQGRDLWGRPAAKDGRVLVDDRLSGRWEPASRRLDNTWFGDMATYSFASAVEYLGYHFTTTVNTDRRYTPELLAAFDVLILKTPAQDLQPEEEQAILDWVAEGGGLYLIGDHTNLFWSSSRLNRLARPAGIRFRSDSVMAAQDGSFSYYRPPGLGRHPAVRRLRTLEFMTSCSLALEGDARPMIVVPGQVSQDHDYARNSHFSTVSSDPALPYGPAVLAATAPLGRGRIAAFGDSTVLSSFALFSWGRDHLLVDTVAFLNVAETGSRLGARVALGLGLALLVLSLRLLVTSADRSAVLAALAMALLVGVPAGQALADGWELRHHPTPDPVRPVPRAAILAGDSEALFPPVLGSIEGLDTAWCFDTLLAAIPRSGVMPILAADLDEALDTPCILVLSPRQGPDAEQRARLGRWLRDGGHLVVAVRDDHRHPEAVRAYLSLTGAASEVSAALVLPGAEPEAWAGAMTRSSVPLGAGSLTLVTGLERWSRDDLGHCFNVPLSEGRRHYDAIASLVAPVAPAHRRTFALLD